jgi:hypothetical protein
LIYTDRFLREVWYWVVSLVVRESLKHAGPTVNSALKVGQWSTKSGFTAALHSQV